MARQLFDLIQSLTKLSDQDLEDKIIQIRKNKNTVKPATKQRQRTQTKQKAKGIVKLFESLTEEEKTEMIKKLGGGE